MTSSLANVIGGYFHQDVGVVSGTYQAAARDAAHAVGHRHRRHLIDAMNRLLTEPDDDKLAATLADYGCDLDLKVASGSAHEWLRRVRWEFIQIERRRW